MKEFLNGYLPRLMPDLDFLCIKHEGKQDLAKSIPRKIRAFHGALFVVVQDNDDANCRVVKKRLKRLCSAGGKPNTLVRIACQELEAWYLGVPEILTKVYTNPKLVGLGRKARYRDPDQITSPSSELEKLVPEFRKIDGARRLGVSMPLHESENRSKSFRVFVEGIRRLAFTAKK